MATALKIGPADHGRSMSFKEFMAGDYEEGSRYELIDGRLYVSPMPNLPEGWVDEWLHHKVYDYSRTHPEVINFVTNKARVFVPGRSRTTTPEPDLAAYHDFPRDLPIRRMRWRNVSPLLVGEVISRDDPAKDLVRNVVLYLQVSSIKEYWILDTRENADEPTLHVYRRQGARWRQPLVLNYGATYATKLLPGFELTVDPRS